MYVCSETLPLCTCSVLQSVSSLQMGKLCELEIVVNIDHPAFIMCDSSHLLGFC